MFDLGSLGELAKNGAEFMKGASAIASSLNNKEKEKGAVASEESKNESMYSAQLEKLIAMAIEDGEITEDDMAMLRRRAEKEGVDPDELEFVVRKRLKKSAGEDPYKGLTPVQKLHKMLADCVAEKKSKASQSLKSLGSVADLIPGMQGMGGLMGEGLSEMNDMKDKAKKKATVIAGFPFPENNDNFGQVVNFLIIEFENNISMIRNINTDNKEGDLDCEKMFIQQDPYLSALYSKLRMASGLNLCTDGMRERISLVLEPPKPVKKKRFGLF